MFAQRSLSNTICRSGRKTGLDGEPTKRSNRIDLSTTTRLYDVKACQVYATCIVIAQGLSPKNGVLDRHDRDLLRHSGSPTAGDLGAFCPVSDSKLAPRSGIALAISAIDFPFDAHEAPFIISASHFSMPVHTRLSPLGHRCPTRPYKLSSGL